ncbi:MAG: hypothetical protein IJW21_09670, partial [Clostridia bacterium]|nr:hypothetical protein [Clostridia bacterium]
KFLRGTSENLFRSRPRKVPHQAKARSDKPARFFLLFASFSLNKKKRNIIIFKNRGNDFCSE